MGLGKMVYASILDIEETFKKIEELNLQVEFNTFVNAMYFIILHHSHHEDFEEKLDFHLITSAMSQALQEFTDKDKDLINPEIFANKMHDVATLYDT